MNFAPLPDPLAAEESPRRSRRAPGLTGLWWRICRIVQVLVARGRLALGYPARLDSADRQVMERQILPWLCGQRDISRMVFVGCDWYTAHYERLLPGITLHTIDPDPIRRRYGAARHQVGLLQDLASSFGPASLDVIVCNGVYGWGLDTQLDCERAFHACAVCLRQGGWFVLGWNNVPAHDPVPLSALSFEGLVPCTFGRIGVARLEVVGSVDRHTYAFYRRVAA